MTTPRPQRRVQRSSVHFFDYLWVVGAPVSATLVGVLVGFVGVTIPPTLPEVVAMYCLLILFLNMGGGYAWASYDCSSSLQLYFIVSAISALAFAGATWLQGGPYLVGTAGAGFIFGLVAKKGRDEF